MKPIDQMFSPQTCAVMFDHEAEQTVLAAFMASPTARRQLTAEVPADAFVEPSHVALWTMLVDLHSSGVEIDPSAARRETRRQKLAITDEDLGAIMSRHGIDATAAIARVKSCRRRRWLWNECDATRRAIEDPDADAVTLGSGIVDRVGEMVRRATRSADRGGGAADLERRFADIVAGRIANLDWPYSPVLTRAARPLESGSITMLSGAPGDGKTFWLLQSLLGWVEQGVNASICMLEKPREWHLQRCIALIEKNADLMRPEWIMANPTIANVARERNADLIERMGECISEGRKVGETLEQIGRWIDAEADENQIVVVDPISLADAGEKRWLADGNFIRGCIRTCERTNCRLILVTHPNSTKGGPPTLASLMGGSTYQRATDSVLHVTKLDQPKRFDVTRLLAGTSVTARLKCNRTVSIFKGRNGSAGGKRFAFDFDGKTLQFGEQGLITGEVKEGDEDDERNSEAA